MNDLMVTDLAVLIQIQLGELESRIGRSSPEAREIYQQVQLHLDVVMDDLDTLHQLGER